MIFLLSQIILALAISALMGGAIGWLLHRYNQRRFNEALRQTLARQQRHLNQAQSEVALLTEEFDELREQSAKQIEMLEQENRQVPLLTSNLEKSQLLVRQMIQRHDVKQRELTLKNERLATRIQQLEQQQNLHAAAQAEHDRLMRESAAQVSGPAEHPAFNDPDNSEFSDSVSDLHAAVMDADFEPGGPEPESAAPAQALRRHPTLVENPVENQESAGDKKTAASAQGSRFKINQNSAKQATASLTASPPVPASDYKASASSNLSRQSTAESPDTVKISTDTANRTRHSDDSDNAEKRNSDGHSNNRLINTVSSAGGAVKLAGAPTGAPAGATGQATRYAAAESLEDPFDEVMELDDDVQISFDSDQSDFAPSPSGISKLPEQADSSGQPGSDENPEDAAAALADESDHPLLDGSTDVARLFDAVDQHDDLQKIFGIGPVTEKALNKLGITSYSQLAGLKEHDIEKIATALDIVPGRIQRDNWVGSARRQLEDVLEQL